MTVDIVLIAGITTLLLLGFAIGVLDRRDRYEAWLRIAGARRQIGKCREALRKYEDELVRRELELDDRERVLELRDELDRDE